MWAGVIPMALTAGAPVGDPRLGAGIAPTDSVQRWDPQRSQR